MSLNSSTFKSRSLSLLLALFFFWIIWVLAQFFIHCPEDWLFLHLPVLKTPDFFKFLKVLTEFSSIFTISLWVLALMGWTGYRILGLFGVVNLHASLSFCLEMGLGIFFWNLFWLGLGLTRLWFGPLWLMAMVLASMGALPDLLGAVQNFKKIKKPDFPLWFVFLTAVYGITAAIHAMLPEIFYDSLNYFLGLPQFWIYQHGITDNVYQLLSGYFYGGSMFFMGGWVLAGTEGAKLLSVAAWALCGFLAYGWVEELSDKKSAVLAVAAVLTFPLLYLNAWAVRVDGLSTFVLLLFLYALSKTLNDSPRMEQRQWLVLAALFAGLAVAIKPTALVMITAAALVLLVRREKKWQGEWIFSFFSFSFLGFLLVGPWLVKNWVFAGNPFFPYAFSWMGGRSLPIHGYQRLLWENRQYLPMDHGFWSRVDLLWRLSIPNEGDNQMIGPLILAFLPGLFLFKLREPQKFLTGVMSGSFILGFLLSHMLRFSMPAFILALILFSVVFTAVEIPLFIQWSWKIAVGVFAVFFLGAYALISAQYYQGWDRWTGMESREAYLCRQTSNSYEPLVLWIDQNLPADARLLIVGDARGLYYPRFFYANSVFDEPFLVQVVRQAKDAGDILKRLNEEGITHVVINGPEGLRLSADYGQYEMTPEEWTCLNDFEARGLKPLYWKNFQAVYEVKDRLTEEKTPYLLNLFSFLPPSAYDFSHALQIGDKPEAHRALVEQIKLFPREQYWLDQLKTQK